MRRRMLPFLLAAVLILAPAAVAQPPAGDCLIGPGLASTMLAPYFEVDLTDPAGLTTLISVNNGFATPAMARVVLWTDWGISTLAFDVYLDGFDVQTINIGSLFNGVVPSTGGSADLSGFPFCDVLPPFHANPALTQDEIDQLRADHTGQQGPLAGDCAGSPHADQIARGYVTIDVVDECSGLESFTPIFTPADPTDFGYFADGGGSGGIAISSNVLWGDVFYVDPDNNAAQGSEMIAIWSDPAQFAGTDIFTFYGRYSGWDGRDERVPLPRLWDQRFLNGGPFAGGAELIVWRDTGVGLETAACGGGNPSWVPLASTAFAVDEDADNLVDLGNGVLPFATQRVDVTGLAIPYPFGWIQLDSAPYQSWVQPALTALGLYSASLNGTPVAFLCSATPPASAAVRAPKRAPIAKRYVDLEPAVKGRKP